MNFDPISYRRQLKKAGDFLTDCLGEMFPSTALVLGSGLGNVPKAMGLLSPHAHPQILKRKDVWSPVLNMSNATLCR